ncbi:hypothetical protein [Streptomyces nigrescens]|uniref:hypothetical protein n=1 Tax=Streptomyces nigrescens TaxID=1920 RepID=UPI0036F7B900
MAAFQAARHVRNGALVGTSMLMSRGSVAAPRGRVRVQGQQNPAVVRALCPAAVACSVHR